MPDRARRRVVVTGMGCVTPVGNDVESAWNAVLAGVSGAGQITLIDPASSSVHIACEVKGFNPTAYLDEKTAKRTARFTQFAMATAKMAFAGIPPDSFVSERAGAVYASSAGGIRIVEEQCEVYRNKGPKRIGAIALPILMINNAPSRLAIAFGLKGPNYAVTSACSGSLHAIGLAMRHIQWGEADLMFTGGAEAGISIMVLGGLASLGALSTRNCDPASASRPFDKERDGLVMGEGAGTLILEELEHARARKAPIFAEVMGFGFTNDAGRITAPDRNGAGIGRAMIQAIADAGLTPGDIDYVNANGDSTQLNDLAEARALRQVFGPGIDRVAISSTKGQTGHLLGAAGAVESILGILAARNGEVPPTINHHTPDPACGIDVTPNLPRKKDIRFMLINNFGVGGHNASLCLARFEK